MDLKERIRAIEQLLAPVVEDLGYELVDLQLRSENGRAVLRLLVDRPGGIKLDECSKLSREVAPHLEVADPIRGSYVLEVSSPGVQRPLRRAAHFEQFAGERALVRTREPVAGRKTFRGTLRGLAEDGRVLLQEGEDGPLLELSLDSIREARLDPELPFS